RQSHTVAGLAGFGHARVKSIPKFARRLRASCFPQTGVAVKGGTIMAHSVLASRNLGRNLKARALASSFRIVGALTILSLLTIASLRAQDRTQPSDGPRTAPRTPGTPVPAPQAVRVERAPEPVRAAEVQLTADQ